jgi:hypothetical protein
VSELIVNGRRLKPSEPGQLFLGRVWSVRFQLQALGESEKEFLLGLERQLVTIAFDHLNFRHLMGKGRYILDVIDLRRDVTLLSLTGEGELEQLSTLPETLSADMQVSHGVTLRTLERAAETEISGLCPPDVNVDVRRTERVRGIDPGTIVIQMSVGGNPW